MWVNGVSLVPRLRIVRVDDYIDLHTPLPLTTHPLSQHEAEAQLFLTIFNGTTRVSPGPESPPRLNYMAKRINDACVSYFTLFHFHAFRIHAGSVPCWFCSMLVAYPSLAKRAQPLLLGQFPVQGQSLPYTSSIPNARKYEKLLLWISSSPLPSPSYCSLRCL